MRTWEKRVEHRVLTESLEEARTTDINGTERWSLAAKKQMVRDTNSTFNPSATLNSITIPASTVPVTAGGALGMSGQMSSGTHNVVDQGSEFIQEATLKAIETIKNARTITVETTTETGREETGRETLANPNRCNTLTYFYYEVIEDYRITVGLGSVDLFLFVPLPMAIKITPKWLVDHECLLRPIVPCENLRKGFDAARRLLTLKKARELREARALSGSDASGSASGSAAPDTGLANAIAAGDAVVATYKLLSGARQTPQGAGSWLYWELVKLLSPDLQRALDTLAERWEDSAFDKTDRPQVQGVLQQFEADLGDLNAEFMKVNAAVVFIATGEVAASLFFFLVPIGALVATLEFLGIIDVLVDDRGLETKVEQLLAKLHGVLEPPLVAPAPPAASTAASPTNTVANGLALQMRQERELMEEVEAQVQCDALSRHIFASNHHYHQIIWSRYDPNQIKLRLQELGIPVSLFELRLYGFDLHYGAIRVVDFEAAAKYGFDRPAFSLWRKTLLEERRVEKVSNLSMPTGGTIVEPYLGQCQGADDFVDRHRALDLQGAELELADARARVSQAEEEVNRMQARLAAGVLDDPTPFGRAGKVVVHVAESAADT